MTLGHTRLFPSFFPCSLVSSLWRCKAHGSVTRLRVKKGGFVSLVRCWAGVFVFPPDPVLDAGRASLLCIARRHSHRCCLVVEGLSDTPLLLPRISPYPSGLSSSSPRTSSAAVEPVQMTPCVHIQRCHPLQHIAISPSFAFARQSGPSITHPPSSLPTLEINADTIKTPLHRSLKL
ncbi:hypothetical protein BDN70DRAFT_297606 [Pholiota conissans]|uniref:Uncharacterized protein n=1 Tax=Pholiota conissans TaxID=109636 RepID=A0A9P5YTC6_9AGAR|nr:hypothetical protein BDN70DRAFT_297606 [Pholiota conissans]